MSAVHDSRRSGGLSGSAKRQPGGGTWAVDTHQLSRVYGKEEALASIDLRVPPGSAYLLAGTNGAGKSTLLRLLLNLERPTSGSARIFGLDPQADGPRVRALSGYMSEEVSVGPKWMTVAQLFACRAAYYPTWDQGYASSLIQSLGIRTERRAGHLSKGQARRAQIVTALAHRPRLILLDEPTDGLDPLVRVKVLSIFASHMAENDCTMIVSTHLVAEVERLVDHVGVIQAGLMLAQGNRDDLLSTIRRYQVTTPNHAFPDCKLGPALLRAEPGLGRAMQYVIQGDEQQTVRRLEAAGGHVRSVSGVSLSELVLILMQNGTTL